MVKTLCIDVLSDNSACGVHRIIITIIIFKHNGGGDQERMVRTRRELWRTRILQHRGGA